MVAAWAEAGLSINRYGCSVRLGDAVWPEVDETNQLLIPLGSTEQHGPHLPFDTDSQIAVAVADAAARRMSDVTVAPVLAYGASGEHADFRGTLSIGTEALQVVLIELVRSASLTYGSITLVNGHGGNHVAVTAAVEQLAHEGHQVSSWSPRVVGGDAHAGLTETSLMLAIAPGSVRRDSFEIGSTEPLVNIMTDLRSGGVAAVSPNGVLGDPTTASTEHGAELLELLVDQLLTHLRRRR